MEKFKPHSRRGPPNLEVVLSHLLLGEVGSERPVGDRKAAGWRKISREGEILLLGNLFTRLTYNVAINDLENLYGVPLGGGETSFFVAPAGIADTADVADSILVPDTGVVDTVAAEIGIR
ncbi:MAG: hypothetical protein CM1200mP14_08940 [Gammaproteobacteria bacterium]|nr:MAG: hypothetical protein CM1200mP14_08940 [Gammaproteobacteria bacterium]